MVATLKSVAKTAVWELKSGDLIKTFDNSNSVPHGVAISSDSKYAFISVEGVGGEPHAVDHRRLDAKEVTECAFEFPVHGERAHARARVRAYKHMHRS